MSLLLIAGSALAFLWLNLREKRSQHARPKQTRKHGQLSMRSGPRPADLEVCAADADAWMAALRRLHSGDTVEARLEGIAALRELARSANGRFPRSVGIVPALVQTLLAESNPRIVQAAFLALAGHHDQGYTWSEERRLLQVVDRLVRRGFPATGSAMAPIGTRCAALDFLRSFDATSDENILALLTNLVGPAPRNVPHPPEAVRLAAWNALERVVDRSPNLAGVSLALTRGVQDGVFEVANRALTKLEEVVPKDRLAENTTDDSRNRVGQRSDLVKRPECWTDRRFGRTFRCSRCVQGVPRGRGERESRVDTRKRAIRASRCVMHATGGSSS